MIEKNKINEIVYKPGMSFKKAESYFFKMDKSGPLYQFIFGKKHFSPQEAFSNNDYVIKQVSDGKIIENEIAKRNLVQKLTTTIGKNF